MSSRSKSISPTLSSKHADDFARLIDYLEEHDLPVPTASLDFMTLVVYVTDLRTRPKVSGVWRGGPDALGRSLAAGPVQTLSANSVNAYLRPIRSLAIWLFGVCPPSGSGRYGPATQSMEQDSRAGRAGGRRSRRAVAG